MSKKYIDAWLRVYSCNVTKNIKCNKKNCTIYIEELRELKDTKPNITVRNNNNVYITINNFNETEKEWSKEKE